MFTICGALHPKSDVDKLYIPRKEGGRGLISIEDCVELDGLEAAHFLKRSKKEKRSEDWQEKVLHGQYLTQTKEVRRDQCWA